MDIIQRQIAEQIAKAPLTQLSVDEQAVRGRFAQIMAKVFVRNDPLFSPKKFFELCKSTSYNTYVLRDFEIREILEACDSKPETIDDFISLGISAENEIQLAKEILRSIENGLP